MKYLIVGLGNVGAEYHETRHNIGFIIVDALAKDQAFNLDKLAYVCKITHKGRQLILIKPTTYMNLSGKAVVHHMQYNKIPLENVLVVTDDLALPFGTLRIRKQGSDGGHNGLRNIAELLKTEQYCRLRIGIGNNFHTGKQVDYVLSTFSSDEKANLINIVEKAKACILDFTFLGIEQTMTLYNKK
jgi:PTH1 family peptidyl-tRNA hydrolase